MVLCLFLKNSANEKKTILLEKNKKFEEHRFRNKVRATKTYSRFRKKNI